jgi:hypothetical protein
VGRARPLNVTRPLLHEARHLLDDELGLRDRAVYLSVVAAIAGGATTSGRIAERLRRSASTLAHPRCRCSPASACRAGRRGRVWRTAQPTWRSRILGPHLQNLAREWTTRHAGVTTTGGPLATVGSTVLLAERGRARPDARLLLCAAGGLLRPTAPRGRRPRRRARRSRAPLPRRIGPALTRGHPRAVAPRPDTPGTLARGWMPCPLCGPRVLRRPVSRSHSSPRRPA